MKNESYFTLNDLVFDLRRRYIREHDLGIKNKIESALDKLREYRDTQFDKNEFQGKDAPAIGSEIDISSLLDITFGKGKRKIIQDDKKIDVYSYSSRIDYLSSKIKELKYAQGVLNLHQLDDVKLIRHHLDTYIRNRLDKRNPVSYTHLTLPTN